MNFKKGVKKDTSIIFDTPQKYFRNAMVKFSNTLSCHTLSDWATSSSFYNILFGHRLFKFNFCLFWVLMHVIFYQHQATTNTRNRQQFPITTTELHHLPFSRNYHHQSMKLKRTSHLKLQLPTFIQFLFLLLNFVFVLPCCFICAIVLLVQFFGISI